MSGWWKGKHQPQEKRPTTGETSIISTKGKHQPQEKRPTTGEVELRETCDSEEIFRVENDAAGGGAASTVYCGTSDFGWL